MAVALELLGEVWAIAGAVGPVDVRVYVRGITAFHYGLSTDPQRILAAGVPLSQMVIQNLGSVSIEIGNDRGLRYGEGVRIPANSIYSNGAIQPGGPGFGVIEKFAKAGLPAVGNAGRLVELTDYDRSIWVDDGVQFRSLSGEVINVKAYGAVGDGVADDSAAILAAVNAAAATAVGAYKNRSAVYFPPGVYKITQSAVVTQSNTTSIRAGIHFFGAGMYTSILRLAPSGTDIYFYDNGATPRMQGCTFADIGFEGMDPANFTAYTDINLNAKGFRLWATSATGSHEQSFQFTRCRFFGLASVWETAGDNTTSETIFVQCKFDKVRTQFALINNLQSNDHEFVGCEWTEIYGDVFVIGANGGGAIKVTGGSVIMQSQPVTETYFFKQLLGFTGEVADPFYFDGVKMELLGDHTNLVNIDLGPQTLNFEKCGIHSTASVDKPAWVTIKQQAVVYFRRCSFIETAAHIKFLVNSTAASYNINGEIIFEECELAPDWSDRCTVAVTGLISARGCFGNNIAAQSLGAHYAHDFDLRTGSTLGQVGVWDGTGTLKDTGGPTHPQWVLKTATIKQEQENWPISVGTEMTLKLPKGAIIKAIHLRKPIRSVDATNVNLNVGNNTKGVVHLTTNTAAWGPNAHVGDLNDYYYCVSDAVVDRTLRLWNSGLPAQTIYGGLAIVEYY